MNNNTLFIIATTVEDTELTIHTFHTNFKALKFAGEFLEDTNFRKPDAHENIQDYLSDYYKWVREENDNMTDYCITWEIKEDQELGKIPIEEPEVINFWDFVAEHYPNYDHCQDIAKMDDLNKLLSNQWDENDGADWTRKNKYGNDPDPANNIQLAYDAMILENIIMKRAMANYIDEKPEPKEHYFLFGEDACKHLDEYDPFELDEDEINDLAALIQDENYAKHKFTSPAIDPFEILNAYDGWGNFSAISKELFEKI